MSEVRGQKSGLGVLGYGSFLFHAKLQHLRYRLALLPAREPLRGAAFRMDVWRSMVSCWVILERVNLYYIIFKGIGNLEMRQGGEFLVTISLCLSTSLWRFWFCI